MKKIILTLLVLCGVASAQPVSSGGLLKVGHDGTLAGNGTNPSPLGLAPCGSAGQTWIWNGSSFSCTTASGITGTITSPDLIVATGTGTIGNFAGSSPSPCAVGNVITQVTESATGALSLTCTAIGTAGGVTGTGTSGTLTKWAGTTAVGNAGVLDNGTTVSTAEAVSFSGGETLTGGLLTDSFNVGVISPSAISGTVDDWNPTGLQTAAIIQIANSSDVNLNGIVAPTGFVGGRKLCLRNAGSNTINIANEALTSSANNRFATAGGATWRLFGGNKGVTCFFYDVAAHRWDQEEKITYPTISVGQSGTFTVGSSGAIAAPFLTMTGNITSLISSDQKVMSIDTTGATVTTAGGAVTDYGVYSKVNSTRTLGAPNLTNIGGFFTATAGDINYALETFDGNNHFNLNSGSSEFHGNVIIDGTCTGCGGTGLSGLTTNKLLKATGTTSAGNSSNSDDGTTTTFGDALAFGVLSPTSISGTNNDWAPTSVGTAIIIRIATSAVTDLTGLSTCSVDGRVVILRNVSTNVVRLWDSDTRSTTAADRFILNNDIVSLPPGEAMAMTCSTNDSRWHQIALSYSSTENKYKSAHLEYNEEFAGLYTSTNTSTPLSQLFMIIETGTGATIGSVSTTTGIAGRPSVAVLGTGTTTTGQAAIASQRTLVSFSEMTGWFAATILDQQQSNATDDHAVILGFTDNAAGVPVDGIYFLADGQNHIAGGANTGKANDWEVCASNNSTRLCYLLDGTTTCDGGFTSVAVPISTTVYERFTVVYSPGEADFYVDQGSGRTKVCQITTSADLPNASVSRATGVGIGIFKQLGTTSHLVNMDQVNLGIDLAAARSI